MPYVYSTYDTIEPLINILKTLYFILIIDCYILDFFNWIIVLTINIRVVMNKMYFFQHLTYNQGRSDLFSDLGQISGVVPGIFQRGGAHFLLI